MASLTIPAITGVAPNFNVQALIDKSLAANTLATKTTATSSLTSVTAAQIAATPSAAVIGPSATIAATSQAPPSAVMPTSGGQAAATNSLQAILGNLLVSSILAPQAQLNAVTNASAAFSKVEGVAATTPTAATAAVLSNPGSGGAQSNLGAGVLNRPPDQDIKAAVWQMVSQMFELP
jgi:hypothetical protein